MKAIVMEIKKRYCIVLTRDGKFLKYSVPAGSVEIGDKIDSLPYKQYEPGRIFIKNFAVAAASVVVIVTGAVFAYRYYNNYFYSRGSSMEADRSFKETAAAENAVEAESGVEEEEELMAQEAPASDESTMEESVEISSEDIDDVNDSEDSSASVISTEEAPSEEGKINFIIELAVKEIENKATVGNLVFFYFSEVQLKGNQLLLNIENLNSELQFNGEITVEILSVEDLILAKTILKFENFKIGEINKNIIPFSGEADLLRVTIKGNYERY